MNESTPPSRLARWQGFLRRISTGIKRAFPFGAGILAAFFGLWLYNAFFPGPQPLTARDVKDTVASVMASATPPPPYSARVYRIIQPSLVLIQTETLHSGQDNDFGLGTGVVVTQQGDILTSLHVVAGASKIKVTFADGTQSGAEVVASQPENDIAVLQAIQPPPVIVPAVLGNPGAMRVGDEAFAVGNPFGLYSSMSAGVISGFDRTFELPNSDIQLQGLIQIDAAVNPGNSGGPLLNRYGQVVGIVTGIINPTEQNFFVGIGFAVPINVAVSAAGGSPPY